MSRVASEWGARAAAEYASAAITQQFVLWMMQAGAPVDLIDDGIEVVKDELVHSRMSFEVFGAAGGVGAPRVQENAVVLPRGSSDLAADLTSTVVRVFCLGETIAVPLFRHLRRRCTQPVARTALDRILRDEVRHRDFGWDVFDWLLQADETAVRSQVESELPAMSTLLETQYGARNRVVRLDDGAMDDDARAWGLAPPREYADILERTIERDYVVRFAARGIDWHAVHASTVALPGEAEEV